MFTRTESFKEFIRYYPVVSTIISIHIVLYLLTVLPFLPNSWVLENFAGVNLYIVKGEYWRLFTPIIMHSGFAHMLFNSFSLVLFGPALEQILGKGKFIFVYLASGIAANVATLLLEPLTYIHVGSSGAIFGLFGFFSAVILFRKDLISKANAQIILTITVVGIIMTFLEPNINVTAHLFGLLAGFLIGVALLPNKRKPEVFFNLSSSIRWPKGRPSPKQISPTKLLIWGGIIVLAILGFLFRQ
ncbi:rhomboid family intramembrane serine protease [Bacillus sp. FJAT-29790]|uniref:rhomboid family intramembrane serine protease n=1 Tax=Bacillus sp. FJAT-29790 TaxID=1895002 RepID=UPI001C230754|nr:rhomboid family intramembrane serine protease [Bacillus sp. FJAT-29790]MBU8879881.1 rhomboid family intramembrane serine protease [Bacillus sp. FJAT-29790]